MPKMKLQTGELSQVIQLLIEKVGPPTDNTFHQKELTPTQALLRQTLPTLLTPIVMQFMVAVEELNGRPDPFTSEMELDEALQFKGSYTIEDLLHVAVIGMTYFAIVEQHLQVVPEPYAEALNEAGLHPSKKAIIQ